VDDNHAHSYALSRILSNAGFDVRQAYGGRSALRIAHPAFDVILLDVNMPDMNGFEVCKRLKAKPLMKHIPVVLVSATAELEEGRIRAKSAGAEELYQSPIDPGIFISALRKLIHREN
jgi:CheY-like chemotaxis protein